MYILYPCGGSLLDHNHIAALLLCGLRRGVALLGRRVALLWRRVALLGWGISLLGWGVGSHVWASVAVVRWDAENSTMQAERFL